jgi:hypothetical protein
MRLRRLSFVAGWTAVVLLAVIGFSAFGTPDGPDPDTEFETAASSMGHTTGAYAGVTFALLSGDPGGLLVDPSGVPGVTSAEEDTQPTLAADGATTTSIPIEVNASGWLSEIQVRALVSVYFQPRDVNQAVRIAWCESRFDPESVNLRTGGIGLFQHLPRYWEERADAAGFAGADPTDPEASTAAAAWEVYNGGGWEIFSCRG